MCVTDFFQLPFWIFLTSSSHRNFSRMAMDNGQRWSKLLHTSAGSERGRDEQEEKALNAEMLR